MSRVHVDFEPEAAWKHALQSRINDNLEKMLQDARTSFELDVANVPLTCPETRYKLTAEYTRGVEFLRAIAGEEYEHAVERERREREWSAHCGVMPEEWSSALRQEQEAILEAIERKKGTPVGVERPSRETTIPDKVKCSTTSMPSTQPTPHTAGSADTKSPASSVWTNTKILDDQHETPEEAAARERQEKHERQQEEFRKRAEEIKRRTAERKRQAQAEFNTSSTSSTSSSSSDNGDPYPSPHGLLSDEDTIKLLIFHDQQWSRIAEYTSLHWSDFPWPVLSFAGPKNPGDLTLVVVSAYILSAFDLRRDKARSKERLREHIRKWHPDRFEGRFLKNVPEGREREKVRLGAGMVARFLNDLLARFHDLG
ncbi:uncharacterized protein LACBIDRAFT_308113 [Laccaria bicolor S238N-H82]|uniref:Predicted protein n=1 Tax=Laccaria bicolor (strain S238N-H82 / ATCC MYA-4686) TaxID=486041 RepID=B0DRP1_LACBS|nr:uncharacterized protein LACBIDRAFT_308113 [Laccaria bicolor S238N-H82]EDR02902.1 predicted protein [Laccaria bicolor S238N-H82]|eukprot:XP_001886612.1 predicted protein [Laccaria bicolor S238N-H82]